MKSALVISMLFILSCSNLKRTPAELPKNFFIEETKKPPTLDPEYREHDLNSSSDHLKSMVKTLHERCPPEDCIIISPGRSLVVVVEYLNSLSDNYAFQIPLSSFLFSPTGHGKIKAFEKTLEYSLKNSLSAKKLPRMSKELEMRFFNHVKSFLPAIKDLSNKKVMIVDYGVTGHSLFSFTKYMRRFFKSYLIDTKVDALAVSSISHLPKLLDNARGHGIDFETIMFDRDHKGTNLGASFSRSYHKKYSYYETYNLITGNLEFNHYFEDPLPIMKKIGIYGKESLTKKTFEIRSYKRSDYIKNIFKSRSHSCKYYLNGFNPYK